MGVGEGGVLAFMTIYCVFHALPALAHLGYLIPLQANNFLPILLIEKWPFRELAHFPQGHRTDARGVTLNPGKMTPNTSPTLWSRILVALWKHRGIFFLNGGV